MTWWACGLTRLPIDLFPGTRFNLQTFVQHLLPKQSHGTKSWDSSQKQQGSLKNLAMFMKSMHQVVQSDLLKGWFLWTLRLSPTIWEFSRSPRITLANLSSLETNVRKFKAPEKYRRAVTYAPKQQHVIDSRHPFFREKKPSAIVSGRGPVIGPENCEGPTDGKPSQPNLYASWIAYRWPYI